MPLRVNADSEATTGAIRWLMGSAGIRLMGCVRLVL
jgi:hypothetical protein